MEKITDREEALKFIGSNYDFDLNKISNELLKDEDFACEVILKFAISSQNTDSLMAYHKKNKNFILSIAKHQPRIATKYISSDMSDDEKFMFELCKVSPDESTLDCASIRLKSNKNFVLKLLKEIPYSFSILMKDYEDYNRSGVDGFETGLKNAKKRNENFFKYVTGGLKADPEVALEAVRRCGESIEYVSDQIVSKKDIDSILSLSFGEEKFADVVKKVSLTNEIVYNSLISVACRKMCDKLNVLCIEKGINDNDDLHENVKNQVQEKLIEIQDIIKKERDEQLGQTYSDIKNIEI